MGTPIGGLKIHVDVESRRLLVWSDTSWVFSVLPTKQNDRAQNQAMKHNNAQLNQTTFNVFSVIEIRKRWGQLEELFGSATIHRNYKSRTPATPHIILLTKDNTLKTLAAL